MDGDCDVDANLFALDCYRNDQHNLADNVHHCIFAGDNYHDVDDEGNGNNVDIDFSHRVGNVSGFDVDLGFYDGCSYIYLLDIYNNDIYY